jgi:hypothetical protein
MPGAGAPVLLAHPSSCLKTGAGSDALAGNGKIACVDFDQDLQFVFSS